MPRKSEFGASQKGESVMQLLQGESTAREIARAGGIRKVTICRWSDGFKRGGIESLQGMKSEKSSVRGSAVKLNCPSEIQ